MTTATRWADGDRQEIKQTRFFSLVFKEKHHQKRMGYTSSNDSHDKSYYVRILKMFPKHVLSALVSHKLHGPIQ